MNIELTADQLHQLEELTRWRIQELDAERAPDRITDMERKMERQHLTALRTHLGFRNNEDLLASKKRRRFRAFPAADLPPPHD